MIQTKPLDVKNYSKGFHSFVFKKIVKLYYEITVSAVFKVFFHTWKFSIERFFFFFFGIIDSQCYVPSAKYLKKNLSHFYVVSFA